jgi:exodeoxyribonuclease-3
MGLQSMGYEVASAGFNQWNGVAILSRVGIEDVQVGFADMPGFGDPHLDYKLSWLDALARAGRGWLEEAPDAQIALLGDWNIAPQDDDVWSVEYYAGRTHTSPAERAAFQSVVEAGFADVVRPHLPGPGVYTYWDYTQLAFQKRRGMRIDFALCSPALATRVTGAVIDREERKGKGASDHAPVLFELDGPGPDAAAAGG